MGKRIKFLFIPLVLAFLIANCSKKISYLLLVDSDKPIYVFGNSDSGPFYKFIKNYLVDIKRNRVYIWDYLVPEAIDAYDLHGKHVFSFGRRGQAPTDFNALSNVCNDSLGNLWIDDNNRKTLKIFSQSGEYIREARLPAEFQSTYIKKMVFNEYDELYILSKDSESNYSVWKINFIKNEFKKIYEEGRRKELALVEFTPDLALDKDSNLYITDSFDYKLHIFNREGQPIKIFSKNCGRKQKIGEEDFNILGEGLRIVKFPSYKEILREITGASSYLPCIFGINIDRDLIYVWTSEMDNQRRYIVDIYDKNFKNRGRACYFNFVKDNMIKIIDGKLYVPRIENYDLLLTGNLSRFSLFNSPNYLQVYAISKKIF